VRGRPIQWYLWTLWLVPLITFPVGLLVVLLSYPNVQPCPPPWPPDSPPQRWADSLLSAHLWFSFAAAVSVPVVFRTWAARFVAWAGVLITLGVSAILTFDIIMSKTVIFVSSHRLSFHSAKESPLRGTAVDISNEAIRCLLIDLRAARVLMRPGGVFEARVFRVEAEGMRRVIGPRRWRS
jgi:hypothetical protein